MKFAIAIFLALPAFSQIVIQAGSPADKFHAPATQCVFNSVASATNPPCVASYPSVNAATMLYGYAGIPFSYSVPAPNGTCDVVLTFIEPTKTAMNQRAFGVSVQGVGLPNIDVYAAVGAGKPYVVTAPGVKVTNGTIAINFRPIISNALVSTIAVQNCVPWPTLPLSFDQLSGHWIFSGDLYVTGSLIVSGTVTTGASGALPSVFTVLQEDGTTCALTFVGGTINLKC